MPVRGIQRAMVKSMERAKQVPHFTYGDELEISQLVELRKQLKPVAEARGINLSFLPFFMKAISLSLNQYPMINAHVNDDCTEVTYKVWARGSRDWEIVQGWQSAGLSVLLCVIVPAPVLVRNCSHCSLHRSRLQTDPVVPHFVFCCAGVPQHWSGHGHAHGSSGAQREERAGPLDFRDCCRAQPPAEGRMCENALCCLSVGRSNSPALALKLELLSRCVLTALQF